MKLQVTITAIALSISSMANAVIDRTLCSEVSFRAFGEPEQTVRDCADPDENFWVQLSIDGSPLPTMTLGLVVPQYSYTQSGGKVEMLTVQVLKKMDVYTVRFQAAYHRHSLYWKGAMKSGESRTLNLDGHTVNVHFKHYKA